MFMQIQTSGSALLPGLLPARRLFSLALALVMFLTLAGCDKKTQRAEVTAKDSVAAAPKDGTPLTNERQLDHERWLIHVMMSNRLRTQVEVTPEMWKSLKVGDRVQVNYEQGRYTGAIWSSRLVKLP